MQPKLLFSSSPKSIIVKDKTYPGINDVESSVFFDMASHVASFASKRCLIHERRQRRVAWRCNDCMPAVISPAIKAHAQMAQSDEQGLPRSLSLSRRKDGLNFSLYTTPAARAHTHTHTHKQRPRIERRRPRRTHFLHHPPTRQQLKNKLFRSFPIPSASAGSRPRR